MSNERHILVGVDACPPSELALDWAVAEAASRTVALHIVCAYQWAFGFGMTPMYADAVQLEIDDARNAGEQTVRAAIERARAADPSLDVSGTVVSGTALPALIEGSQSAEMVVVGSRGRSAASAVMLGSVGGGVAARTGCPAVVVRDYEAGVIGAGVVVGVDGGEDSEAVLDVAFDYASRHRLPLRAVLAWQGHLRSVEAMGESIPMATRATIWLCECLAGWQEKYPDVEVRHTVVPSHAVDALVRYSDDADLLVVGSHGRHALPGTLLGSVSQGALHHATCPIAVVPSVR